MTEGVARHPRTELEPIRMSPEESARGTLGDDQVGRAQLVEFQEAANERVDAGVRRVGDDAERVPRPSEGADVQLQHGDP